MDSTTLLDDKEEGERLLLKDMMIFSEFMIY